MGKTTRASAAFNGKGRDKKAVHGGTSFPSSSRGRQAAHHRPAGSRLALPSAFRAFSLSRAAHDRTADLPLISSVNSL